VIVLRLKCSAGLQTGCPAGVHARTQFMNHYQIRWSGHWSLFPGPYSHSLPFYGAGTATMATGPVPVLLEGMPEVSEPVELLNE